MKVVIQRVSAASVTVDDEAVGEIGRGMLILVGIMSGDDEKQVVKMAEKVAAFRFFSDERGKMNLAAGDLHARGEACDALVVSQFTLAADGKRGRRPSFDRAAAPEVARPLYERFCSELDRAGLRVETGRFGAMMAVSLVNDGPVTFVFDDASS